MIIVFIKKNKTPQPLSIKPRSQGVKTFYSFTAPIVTPVIKYFWQNG